MARTLVKDKGRSAAQKADAFEYPYLSPGRLLILSFLVVVSGLVEQTDRRRFTFGRWLGLGIGGFLFIQTFQYLPDDYRVFYAGDDSYWPLTLFAGFEVNIERPFQPQGPGYPREGIYAGFARAKTGHRGMVFGGRPVIGVVAY